MRALLEYLGIIAPTEQRREPVALPAWIHRAALIAIPLLALVSTVIFAVLRASLT
jgi:hypothetical protein